MALHRYHRSLTCIFVCVNILIQSSAADKSLQATTIANVSLNVDVVKPPSNSLPVSAHKSNLGGGRHGIGVILASLSAMFSFIILLILYAIHCKRESQRNTQDQASTFPTSVDRQNLGVDRFVIRSLPVYRYDMLQEKRSCEECAVCLNGFNSSELLRLLPKCRHMFHVECANTWLEINSTCPLCRYRIGPEDILLGEGAYGHHVMNDKEEPQLDSGLQLVCGWHSWAGEKTSAVLKAGSTPCRRSFNSANPV